MRTKEAIIREAASLAYAAKDPVAIERIIGKCAEELFEVQLGGLPILDVRNSQKPDFNPRYLDRQGLPLPEDE